MKIAIASDHGGYELKNNIYKYLSDLCYEVEDFGCYDKESCDYPIYAKKVAKAVLEGGFQKGILICGTGLGMQIAANKFKGIRAICVTETYSAKMGVKHNNANILTLGERVIGFGLAHDIVDAFLNAEFQQGRHQKRIDMIES